MDDDRYGIRATGDYAHVDGRDLPVRGGAADRGAHAERVFRVRTVCRWCGYRFRVDAVHAGTAHLTYLDGDFTNVADLPGMYRSDKYEVTGTAPVSELTDVEEQVHLRGNASEFAEALRVRMRRGEGLSVPYARRWEIGGCEPDRSLYDHPGDGLTVLGEGLSAFGRPVYTTADRLVVGAFHWVAANRDGRGDGAPDAYLLGTEQSREPYYVGNSAEVAVEILRAGLGLAPWPPTEAPDVTIGFPGLKGTARTYVGAWRWNVHGEASDDRAITWAAAATQRAIDAKNGRDLSAAIVAAIGHTPVPRVDEEKLHSVYGPRRGAEFAAEIAALLREAVATPIEWGNMTLSEGVDDIMARFRRAHPTLTAEALHEIDRCVSWTWR